MSSPLVANVAEAGDIVLYALVVVTSVGVGLALLAIDSVVGRVRARRARRRTPEPP